MKKKLGREFPSVDGVVIEVALRSVSTVKLCRYREKNHVTLAGLGCESCSFFHSYSFLCNMFFCQWAKQTFGECMSKLINLMIKPA